MRLSFDWLSEWVDLQGLTPQIVADKLTMHAFEVEQIRKVGPDINGSVVVGEIVEINPHPDADKIRLTRIKVDHRSEPLDIVCGAQNIIVGQRVPVALPGAQVINRHTGAPLQIEETVIRGAKSCGMLCSPLEIGIAANDVDGIYILSGLPEIGDDVRKLLYLYPDWILDVEPRSNRGDAMCVAGMAREVAALCKRQLREPKWQLPNELLKTDEVKLEVEDPIDCPYLSVRVIEGITVKPSPHKIARRLEAVGMRAINNVVDATNYVNYEMGQPLHAYDLSFLNGPLIAVRRGKDKETMITLDEKRQQLNPEILCITDAKEVIGIAGIMGGKDSEVNDNTSAIALEAAAFSPARIRRGSRLLGKSSEASLRFERGVDIGGVRKASDRCSYLIMQTCGAVLGKLSTVGSDKPEQATIKVRASQFKRIGGIEIPAKEAASILMPLGFEIKEHDKAEMVVAVPSYRQRDVSREIDLIEEVLRVWGFDQIDPTLPASTPAPALPDNTLTVVRQALTACGLNEAITGSLTPRATGVFESDSDKSTVVEVLNPLSEDHQVMRQSMIPGLIRAVLYNQDRGANTIWLFETGRTYHKVGAADDRNTGVEETLMVSGVLAGEMPVVSWRENQHVIDLFTVKGVVENLCQALRIDPEIMEFSAVESLPPWLHPGQSCILTVNRNGNRESIGILGELHPAIAHNLQLRGSAYIFELSVDKLHSARGTVEYNAVHTTPSIVRDLTVDLMSEIRHDDVCECIKKRSGGNLKSVELFNIFKLDDNHRSLTYRITFQHPEETLTNEEVTQKLELVRKSLIKDFKASFR